jgi:hypothetical protein
MIDVGDAPAGGPAERGGGGYELAWGLHNAQQYTALQRCRRVAIVSLRCDRVAVCAMVQACFHGVMRQLVIGRFDEARYAPYARHGPSPAWPSGVPKIICRRPRRLR